MQCCLHSLQALRLLIILCLLNERHKGVPLSPQMCHFLQQVVFLFIELLLLLLQRLNKRRLELRGSECRRVR